MKIDVTSKSESDSNSDLDPGNSDRTDTDTDWAAVLQSRPALRSHIEIYPQIYRGKRWYVLHDFLSGDQLRINAAAYQLVGRLDGSNSLGEIIQLIKARRSSAPVKTPAQPPAQLGDQTIKPLYPESVTSSENIVLSSAEIIRLLVRLSAIGALKEGITSPTKLLVQNFHAKRSRDRWRRWASPLAIRIPLIDPDKFLEKWTPGISAFLTKPFFYFWLVLIFAALSVFVLNFKAVSDQFGQSMGSGRLLIMMWIFYPFLKFVHEFSHAVFLKKGGGEVHEMGITLLLFTPVPYVNASAAWTFPSRRRRVLVSAAGILAEMTIAAVALLFWVSVEPGFLRDCAFTIFLIGTLSTLMFNANPLLKFDGYYMLQDSIEIPNLYSRAQQYYVYLIKRYVLSVGEVLSPVSADGERIWFLLYGISAFLYRNIILMVIAFWLIGKFMFAGLLVTAWVVALQYVLPFKNMVSYFVGSKELAGRRLITSAGLGAAMCLVTMGLALIPVSHTTRTEGVVWVPEQAQIFAQASGIVSKVFVEPGQSVSAGDFLLRLDSSELETKVLVLRARLETLKSRELVERLDETSPAFLSIEDVAALKKELSVVQHQQNSLLIVAKTDGVFTVGSTTRLSGRYFAQGDLIGHVVDRSQLVVRVVVPENRIGAVIEGVVNSEIRLAERFSHSISADVARHIPSANQRLPSAALGTLGGGGIAIAADDSEGLKTVDRVFHLELSLPENVAVSGVGERAYVSLIHPASPLAKRWIKNTRQLFLRRLPDYAT